MTTYGSVKKPMLSKLENLLTKQETLNKQMFKVLVKDEESALLSNKRGYKDKRIKYKGHRQKQLDRKNS